MSAPPSDDRLIDLKEVQRIVGLKKTKIYALIKDEQFPEPRKIGVSSRWRESAVRKWAGLDVGLDASIEELL